MSSKPAMIRASRGEVVVFFFFSGSTPSSARISRSLRSDIGGRLSLKEGDALGHLPFPGIARCQGGEASRFLLEADGTCRQHARFLMRQVDLLFRYDLGD